MATKAKAKSRKATAKKASGAAARDKGADRKTSSKAQAPKKRASPPSGRRKSVKDESGLSADERNHWIAQAAYYRAEKRGFRGGDPVKDWLEAEKEIADTLS